MKKYTRRRLVEVLQKVDPSFNNEGVNLNMFQSPQEYRKKAEEIKAQIDKLFGEEEFDDIDTLYRLLVRRTKRVPQPSPEELKEVFDKLSRHGHQD